MFPDGPSRLQTGQNVGRWAVLSADGPMWLLFAQSADGMSADGMSHLPTFCPICRHFVQSAYWTKCWQMGCPICQRACLQTGCVARYATTSISIEETCLSIVCCQSSVVRFPLFIWPCSAGHTRQSLEQRNLHIVSHVS